MLRGGANVDEGADVRTKLYTNRKEAGLQIGRDQKGSE
jgi:hypothetical protein